LWLCGLVGNGRIDDMGLLKRTKVYLCGGMQYCNGADWRKKVQKELEKMDIIVYNPFNKPFINSRRENKKTHFWLKGLMHSGKYDKVAKYMAEVRREDLRIVDLSDYIFVYIDPKVYTVGSFEEMFWANREKKPIFLVVEGGKKETPFWLMAVLPSRFIYNNIDEALEMIKRIDSGQKKLDSNRWRLLKLKYR
jgi:hypothetical protein